MVLFLDRIRSSIVPTDGGQLAPLRRPLRVARSRLFGDVVTIEGVQLDIGAEWISENMRENLRRDIYEIEETELIRSHLLKDCPVIDLGAGLGYTACLLVERTAQGVPVVAVEPDPYLVDSLRTTRALNNCVFYVVEAAYHTQSETVPFRRAKDFWLNGRFDRDEALREVISVNTVNLSDICKTFDLMDGFQLIVDIEGSEFDLLSTELDLLRNYCYMIIIEFHSGTEHDLVEYKSVLTDAGFYHLDSKRNVSAYINERFS